MTSNPTIEQLRINGRLPSPKGVALAIMEMSRSDDVGIDAIARVVRTDPALSARLLRAANAAALGGRPLAAISDAVTRLGLATVLRLAIGFSLVDQYQEGPCEAFDYPRFWSHSLMMAVAMQELGKLTQVAAAEELFACGLLARIGCLALATLYPKEFAAILESRDGDQLARERALLNADHLEVSAVVMADCGIPKALAEPACRHEAPDTSGFSEGSRPHQLAQLFYLASRLADLGLASENERNGAVAELLLLAGKIGLDADALGALFEQIIEQWREWSDLLRVDAPPIPPFAVLAQAPAPTPEAEAAGDNLPLRVLLVEDDPGSRLLMEEVLADITGQPVHTAADGREGLARALEVMPQIVVTDWLMPNLDGLELTRALRATDWGQSMYILMLTSVETEEDIVTAFEAGVDDYVTKPVNSRAIRARMRAAMHYVKLLADWERDRARLKQFASELAISNRKLERFAHTDQLTGLNNRRAGMINLAQAWSAAQRSSQPLAAMMIDIDLFKAINDSHGHASGDLVLKEVAQAIQKSARKDDFVCRMGGEEFLVICHNADLKAAWQAAERLRQMVQSLELRIGEAHIRVTVSVGVACKEPAMAGEETLVSAADKALYAAKQAGRDRTCLSSAGKLRCGHT